MSSEDFIRSVKTYTFFLADAFDRQADSLATTIRNSLQNSTWLPKSARPPPPPPPPTMRIVSGTVKGYYDGLQNWVWEHRWAVGAVVLGAAGVSGYAFRGKRKGQRKRRAKRSELGGRKEVVVLAGSPHDLIIRSLSLDLERRGFIVFIVVSSLDDEQIVANEGRTDIRPLNIDLLDPESAQASIERFTTFLKNPHRAFPGAPPHSLHLAGVIIVPDLTYPSGPLETLSIETWSDTLNLKLLSTLVITKSFLRTICANHSRLLIMTPSIISSLSAAFHAPETAAVAALEALARSLRMELAGQDVAVVHFKLGTFDCASLVASGAGAGGRSQQHQQQIRSATRADILSWPPEVRVAYARSFVAQAGGVGSRGCVGGTAGNGIKGSSLKELHVAVFDALTDRRPPAVCRIGTGSVLYEIVGKIVPVGLVGWMLGVRKRGGGGGGGVGKKEWGGEGMAEGSAEWEKVERML